MDRKDFAAWCRAATEKIRYGPDREMVSRELLDHLEDRYDALIARGVTKEEAARQTLEAMGSAESIAPQLAAIHRPWLGWIYSTVRFVGIIMVIYAVVFAFVSGYSYLTSWLNMYGRWEEKGVHKAVHSSEHIAYFAEPDMRAYIDGHQLCISEVAVVCSESETPVYRCLAAMKITSWPWNYGFTAGDYFWAVDSEGNYYASKQEYTENTPGIWFVSGGTSSASINYRVFEIDYFDKDAQWVELCYTRDGRNLIFNIDLPGGESR